MQKSLEFEYDYATWKKEKADHKIGYLNEDECTHPEERMTIVRQFDFANDEVYSTRMCECKMTEDMIEEEKNGRQVRNLLINVIRK